MAIPESQLETWAKQGAITTAKSTADSVKNALNSYNNWPNGIDFEVYLQGSYKNDTNIRGDSDVDIVAQLNSTFYSNLSVLSIVVDYSLCRASILPCFFLFYLSCREPKGGLISAGLKRQLKRQLKRIKDESAAGFQFNRKLFCCCIDFLHYKRII